MIMLTFSSFMMVGLLVISQTGRITGVSKQDH
jgi:hypothetical protein